MDSPRLRGEHTHHSRTSPGTYTHDSFVPQVYERLEELDSDNAEARAASLLSGLGFDQEMMQMPTRSHSGGWRMRIVLAQVRRAG